MGSQYITVVAVCFVALLVSCSARHSYSRRDYENSISNETPQELSREVHEHTKEQEFNEDELDKGLERRQVDIQGLTDTSSAIASGFQSQANPEQLQQLKDILSLEMNNKDKFAQVYSQMNPEQVNKIREMVLKIGQQTGSEELIQFGQCKSPQFNEKQVQTLLGLGDALYDRLNTETTGLQVNRASFGQGDQAEMFNQMKSSISKQQDFIRRLVNMIEVQLSKAPQIDNMEFADIKEITQQIKTLSNQVQTQLEEATDLSQLTQMGDELLQINNLSSKLQQKVSAELIEDRIKEYVNSVSSNVQETTGNSNQVTDNTADLQVRDTTTTETQAPLNPQESVEKLLGGVQWFFEQLRKEREQQFLQQGNRPFISKYASQAIRQVQQQYPQVGNTLQYVQQQYPQVNDAIQNIQQQYPQVSDAIQTLQQGTGLTTTEQQTPELLTTQNADGSLTLQAADQLPQEVTKTVETEQVETTNAETNKTPEQQNVETTSVETANTETATS